MVFRFIANFVLVSVCEQSYQLVSIIVTGHNWSLKALSILLVTIFYSQEYIKTPEVPPLNCWLTDPKIFLKAPLRQFILVLRGEGAPKKNRSFLTCFSKFLPAAQKIWLNLVLFSSLGTCFLFILR